MEKREFVITIEMAEDESVYYLRCYLNGEKIKEEEIRHLNETLAGLYFFKRKIDKEYKLNWETDYLSIKSDIRTNILV